MPIVKFTSNLKRYYPDLTSFSSEKTNLRELLGEINQTYPGLQDYILDEQGKLRKHVHIFVGETVIEDRNGLSDPLKSEDQVYIMQALSGG